MSASEAGATRPLSPTQPFYWSLRREIWENKSIYMAPAITVAVIWLACLFGMHTVIRRMREMASSGVEEQGAELAKSFMVTALAVTAATIIVAAFYSLGALHNERRDRSILFWKSLPVSDLTTVLAKVCIPSVVLPIVCFLAVLAMHVGMVILTTCGLALAGLSVVPLWTAIPFPAIYEVLGYILIVAALWYAPIYCWFMLVSGWARSKPLLWAVLPPLALCLFEKIAFDTSTLWQLLHYRLGSGLKTAFAVQEDRPGDWAPPPLDPIQFLGTYGLWVGLAVAAVLIGAAVWLRRYREPV